MPDTININQITKYVKFNKSAIKFNVNENEKFVQPFIIPQRTDDPNAAFLIPEEAKWEQVKTFYATQKEKLLNYRFSWKNSLI